MLVRQAHEIEWIRTPRGASPMEYEDRLLDLCKKDRVDFLGFVGEWKGNRTNISLKCHCSYIWNTASIATFIRGTRCPCCADKMKKENNGMSISKDVYRHRILELCEDKNIYFFDFIGKWKGVLTKIELMCDCGYTWISSINNFVNKKHGCTKCAGVYRYTIEERKTQLLDVCRKHGYSLIEINNNWKGALTKIKLKCNMDGYMWETRINDIINGSHGCPMCGGVVPKAKEERLEQVLNICKHENIIFLGFVDDYVHSKTRMKILCNCGHEYTTNIKRFVCNGSRCPHCASYGYKPTKPGTLYIQKLTNDDSLVGVKFGITNLTAKERMKRQSRVSKLDHEIFYELTLQDGQKILELENKIKEAMKGKTSYISKEDMPDGYTETVAPSELSTIMYIVKTFEKEFTA